ncbi:MAG: hypothetical protein E6767_07360 [Dysgonomonas sp.]|nr:hypothetical protein [Dysgonomonas sp.]
MNIAESLYPKVLKIIEDYEEFVDENGDEDDSEYQRISNLLHEMTGKDMTRYNLYETWEAEGPEVLSFRISLPDPILVNDITDGELIEILKRIKKGGYPTGEEESFRDIFGFYLDDYYHSFLKLNFKKYDYKYFIGQKDGKFFTVEEIAQKIK